MEDERKCKSLNGVENEMDFIADADVFIRVPAPNDDGGGNQLPVVENSNSLPVRASSNASIP